MTTVSSTVIQHIHKLPVPYERKPVRMRERVIGKPLVFVGELLTSLQERSRG